MNITLERRDPTRLVATLREGAEQAEVTAWNPPQAASALFSALDAAEAEGYGECFWPEPTGHFWWMLRRDDRRLEVVVLWSRSSAVGWQHVFRAADEFDYFRDRVREEFLRFDLTHEA